MLFDVISLFPELIESSFKKGITGRALKNSMITLRTWNPRDFAESTKGRIDDRPYGGGPGMVMLADPLIKAIRRAKEKSKKPDDISLQIGQLCEGISIHGLGNERLVEIFKFTKSLIKRHPLT